jgi:hypothetical protein
MESDRIVEERWSNVKTQTMNRRLDTLRSMADFYSKRLHMAEQRGEATHTWERNKAAILWAISELSGIGEEVRRERMEFAKERDANKVMRVRAALARAETAETLNVQFKAQIRELKAELHQWRTGRLVPSAEIHK